MPLDFGSGNSTSQQTETQQNIGIQSTGGRVRTSGGAQATQRGVATTGDKNRIIAASGNKGAVIEGTGNTANQIKTGKGNVSVSTVSTTTGVSGDDLDELIHDVTSASANSVQDFANFASNALNSLTPHATPSPTDNPVTPSQSTTSTGGFLDWLSSKLGLAPNDVMLLLGAIALGVSIYFVKRR